MEFDPGRKPNRRKAPDWVYELADRIKTKFFSDVKLPRVDIYFDDGDWLTRLIMPAGPGYPAALSIANDGMHDDTVIVGDSITELFCALKDDILGQRTCYIDVINKRGRCGDGFTPLQRLVDDFETDVVINGLTFGDGIAANVFEGAAMIIRLRHRVRTEGVTCSR